MIKPAALSGLKKGLNWFQHQPRPPRLPPPLSQRQQRPPLRPVQTGRLSVLCLKMTFQLTSTLTVASGESERQCSLVSDRPLPVSMWRADQQPHLTTEPPSTPENTVAVTSCPSWMMELSNSMLVTRSSRMTTFTAITRTMLEILLLLSNGGEKNRLYEN